MSMRPGPRCIARGSGDERDGERERGLSCEDGPVAAADLAKREREVASSGPDMDSSRASERPFGSGLALACACALSRPSASVPSSQWPRSLRRESSMSSGRGRVILASKTDAAVAAHHYSTFQGRSSEHRTDRKLLHFRATFIENFISPFIVHLETQTF